jgi:hypothetical protein
MLRGTLDQPIYKAQARLDTIWNELLDRCVVLNENYIQFFQSIDAEMYYKRAYIEAIKNINYKYQIVLIRASQDNILNNVCHTHSIQSWREGFEKMDWKDLYKDIL